MNCFLCNQNSLKVIYQLKTRTIIRCQNDGLFLAQEMSKNKSCPYSKNYYNNSPYPAFLNLNQNYFQSKLDKIIKLTSEKKPTVLDVGCGWGNFLEILKKNNLPYLGIDTAQKSVAICQQKKLNCQNNDLETLAKKGKKKYDVITCFQVLEHINNPLMFLSSIKKLLKNNGLLLITTPNNDSPLRKIFGLRWSVYNTESHFVFYNKETLTQTLNITGFKNIKVNIDSLRFLSLGYIISRLYKSHSCWIKKLSIPIPTDFWGDLEAIAFNS